MLWAHLALMWNCSTSPYLICYHGPRAIIKLFDFHVELIAQLATSMHGSKEHHTGYIYKRSTATTSSSTPTTVAVTTATTTTTTTTNTNTNTNDEKQKTKPSTPSSSSLTTRSSTRCDPIYKAGIDKIKGGFVCLKNTISSQMNKIYDDSTSQMQISKLRSSDRKA
jgi:hypothetical protein